MLKSLLKQFNFSKLWFYVTGHKTSKHLLVNQNFIARKHFSCKSVLANTLFCKSKCYR